VVGLITLRRKTYRSKGALREGKAATPLLTAAFTTKMVRNIFCIFKCAPFIKAMLSKRSLSQNSFTCQGDISTLA
jgi:hypothetical protein